MGGGKFQFWCFTVHDENWKWKEHENVRYICFQQEIAPTTGKKHFQGYIELTRQLGLKGCKDALQCPTAHLEVRKGSADEARDYCMKSDTAITDTFFEHGTFGGNQGHRTDLDDVYDAIKNGSKLYEIADKYRVVWTKHHKAIERFMEMHERENPKPFIIDLRIWQKELVEELLCPPDYRKVVWYIDRKGNNGKTTLARFLVANHKAFYCINGKTADVAHAYNGERIVLFDLPRTSENGVNYHVIEALKNGMLFSGKYESKTKVFDIPHVVVFSNFAPDKSALSADRWDIREL